VERGTPGVEMGSTGPRVLLPAVFGTGRTASSTGGEILGTVTPTSWVRVVSSYSLFTISSRLTPGSLDRSRQANQLFDADTPRHQGMIRSLFSLPHRLEFDTSIVLVGALKAMALPGYVLTDARVGWKSRAGLDLALVAQNLLDDNHLEFRSADAFVVPSVARAGCGRRRHGGFDTAGTSCSCVCTLRSRCLEWGEERGADRGAAQGRLSLQLCPIRGMADADRRG
jgi:outer membrane receptor protein involved in Fe transport